MAVKTFTKQGISTIFILESKNVNFSRAEQEVVFVYLTKEIVFNEAKRCG